MLASLLFNFVVLHSDVAELLLSLHRANSGKDVSPLTKTSSLLQFVVLCFSDEVIHMSLVAHMSVPQALLSPKCLNKC